MIAPATAIPLPAAITARRTNCSDVPVSMFQPGLSAAAAIARTPTPAVVSGPANSCRDERGGDERADDRRRLAGERHVGDHADGERQQAGDEPE